MEPTSPDTSLNPACTNSLTRTMASTSSRKRPARSQTGPPPKRRRSDLDAFQKLPAKSPKKTSQTAQKKRAVPVTKTQIALSDSGEEDDGGLGPQLADEIVLDTNGSSAPDRRLRTNLTVFGQQLKNRTGFKKNFMCNAKPQNPMPKSSSRPNASGRMRASSTSPRRSGKNTSSSSWTSYGARCKKLCSNTMRVALFRRYAVLALRTSTGNILTRIGSLVLSLSSTAAKGSEN